VSRATPLFALALAVALAFGCSHDAPITDEVLAREAFVRRLAEREGRLEDWYVMSRRDVQFEDGFTRPSRPHILKRVAGVATMPPGRWFDAVAHLRVYARERGVPMRLRVWGATDLEKLGTRPRLSVTFDGVEQWAQTVDADGRFSVELAIPPRGHAGWSEVYLSLSSNHGPWKDAASLELAVVQGVEWEPAR
jgi:hypothetical protein